MVPQGQRAHTKGVQRTHKGGTARPMVVHPCMVLAAVTAASPARAAGDCGAAVADHEQQRRSSNSSSSSWVAMAERAPEQQPRAEERPSEGRSDSKREGEFSASTSDIRREETGCR